MELACLSVDYSQVEVAANTLYKGDRELHQVLGKLISNFYLEEMCRHVNLLLGINAH